LLVSAGTQGAKLAEARGSLCQTLASGRALQALLMPVVARCAEVLPIGLVPKQDHVACVRDDVIDGVCFGATHCAGRITV